MKAKALFPLFVAAAFVSGCQTYIYHVARPPGVAQPIASQSVTVQYDPLEYRLLRRHGRLDLRIQNPTEDRAVLLGNRSYADRSTGRKPPHSEHDNRATHSFSGMLVHHRLNR